MKTKKQVLIENPDKKQLINAVISRIGLDSVGDVVAHGADTGFSGFTYYSETHAFAMRYRKQITEWLNESAVEMGEEVVSMVSGFGVFRNLPMDNEDRTDLYKYIGGGKPDHGTITNVMAWFALEEVCRLFDE